MLKVLSRLPCWILIHFESLTLRTAGTCFFYTFRSCPCFVRLSLGVNQSAHHMLYDFGHNSFTHKDQLCFFTKSSLTLNRCVLYFSVAVCKLLYALYTYTAKVQSCLFTLIILFFTHLFFRTEYALYFFYSFVTLFILYDDGVF